MIDSDTPWLATHLPRRLGRSDHRGRRLLRLSSISLVNQTTGGHSFQKISGDQIIRSPAAANVNPGSSGTYQITIGIERVQKTRLIWAGIRLNSHQGAFVYEE